MRSLFTIILGVALFVVGYGAGTSNERTKATNAMEKTLKSALTVANERTDRLGMNSYIHDLYARGQLSGEELNAVLEGEEEQFQFIPFFLGWGPITFMPIQPRGSDDVPCTQWIGENEYKCGTEGSRCGIIVDISGGPLKGKYMFTRPCDGVQISKRSTNPGWDGYEIRYTTMTVIE